MAIDKLKERLKAQENLKKNLQKQGKSTARVDSRIDDIKSKIKEEEKTASKKAIKNYKKPKSKISGMSREKCIEALDQLKQRFLKAESTKKKNISSGKANKDGTLKPGSSLDNEAKTIENKADAGNTLGKAQQKKVVVSIDKIAESCIKMIKTQKEAKNVLEDLISRLQGLLDEVKRGKLYYEG